MLLPTKVVAHRYIQHDHQEQNVQRLPWRLPNLLCERSHGILFRLDYLQYAQLSSFLSGSP